MKMKSALIALAAGSAISVLSGCATVAPSAPVDRHTETDRIVESSLGQGLAEIQKTKNAIHRLERAQKDQAAAKAAALASSEARLALLDTRLKIVWKDDSAEDLLKQLAEQLGLAYQTRGEPRALPRVTIEGEALPVRKILEMVGDKIDRNADVVLVKSASPSIPAKLELRFK